MAGTGELSHEPMEKKFINKESGRLREKHDNLQSSERPCQEKKRLFCVPVRGTMRRERGRALQEASPAITLQSFPQPWQVRVIILICQAGKQRLKYNLPKVVSFQRMRIRFPSTSM